MSRVVKDLLNDPVNQFKALTSGDLTQTGKAMFAPSLITQQTPGLVADATKIADKVVAGYFGGPLGVAGAEGLHAWNEGEDIGGIARRAGTAGALSYAGGALSDAAGGATGAVGDAPMTVVSDSGAPMSTTAGLQGLTSGTGMAAGGGTSALSNIGGSGMNLSDALKMGGSLYSGLSAMNNQDEMMDALKSSQTQQQQALSPYIGLGQQAAGQLEESLRQGFDYDAYKDSPAYEFQKQEGQQALDRSLGAAGMGQSGAAIKAGQEYAQGLASQDYQQAYNRYLADQQQLRNAAGLGQGSAGNLADIYGYGGETKANYLGAQQENQNKLVNALLSGAGKYFS